MTRRIVVFTSNPAFSVRKGIVEIDRAIPDLSWLVVVSRPRREPMRLLRSQWLNLRRNGWRWIPYQLADIWQRLLPSGAEARESGGVGAEYTAAALERLSNLKISLVTDINSQSTCSAVAEFGPDLGLSLAAPILRRPLFSIPVLGTLNLHKGRLPDYRGMPPAFWEMWNDEDCVGCTVHRVDEKLDTGAIVAQTLVRRERFSTVRGLQLQLDEVGVRLMRDAAQAVLNGNEAAAVQASGGKTYRKPALGQVAALHRKLARTLPQPRSTVRRSIVRLAGALTPALWRLGLGNTLRPRIVVLLYHRVSDMARDNLTVGVEQFDRQMELIRRHCQPVPIEEVLDSERLTRSRKPRVCITFDDGYLDNYEHAAPILLKHRIPAAFFVSTGMIGSDRPFPHDVRRGNEAIPTMQWQHLREMRSAGFHIGSHSVTHIDCASEPKERVTSELSQSLEDLRRELGLKQVIFAYPYGGRRHMTPERLELVKGAGYIGCLSAYGGVNLGKVDRFNVLRTGIHWEFSDQALLLECAGLR